LTDDRGSVSIVVAASVAIVLVMAMAAADVVRVLAAASSCQTSADAAALAAAQTLALALPDDVLPEERAREYAARNGGALESCVCEPGTLEARVAVRMEVGDLLLFGDGRSVVASALAVVDLPST
jgi:uncharacterized membrane protein